MANISVITHVDYDNMLDKWYKYRLTYAGGEDFRDEYLKQFSDRENSNDYAERKAISYVPAHAKAAINDVKNAIFQRTIDITRKDGPRSYHLAITGNDGGVDLAGNSMDGFIGRLILPELLTMAKVGIYIDKERLEDGVDIRTQRENRPYIYMYKAEDIRSWTYDSRNQLISVLLRDHDNAIDETYGLVTSEIVRYRLLRKTEEGILVQFFNSTGEELHDLRTIVNLPEIPFIILDLNNSLLTDVADYQVALLNMSSGDVNYACKSNFPFYTEQYSPQSEGAFERIAGATTDNSAGTAAAAKVARDKEIKVGTTKGRRYPKGLDAPQFIHPSPEPLMASMEKQEKMKQEIRQLINLAITNIEPRRASAESKQLDEHGLEAGLSYIGLELEYGERFVAKIWATYESRNKPAPATIHYPKKYSLKTDADRRKEGKELTEQAARVPSITYQKETLKEVAEITLGYKIPAAKLDKICNEIDRATVVIMDAETIGTDLDNGLVSHALASKARLYPAGQVEIAAKEHADRLARIAIAQTEGAAAARGIVDKDPEGQKGAVEEKAKIRSQE